MKDHGRYTIDDKPSIVFCSPVTCHELLDVGVPAKSIVPGLFMDDDECVIVPVSDLKKFLEKYDVMKRKRGEEHG